MTMLQGKDQTFNQKWPQMQDVILKLLSQESVSKQEWQDLFWDVHKVCLWDEAEGPYHIKKSLREMIVEFVQEAEKRIMHHQEGHALLKAYIAEWQKFFDQCSYLPKPFKQFEKTVVSQGAKKKKENDSEVVRKIMLDVWNDTIFKNIQETLKDKTMILVKHEREGEVLDAQLVIGVRQSFVNLCLNAQDPLGIYRDHFEKSYLSWTKDHFQQEAESFLAENGVCEYMKYAYNKLQEETNRAERYLESSSIPLLVQQCVEVLVSQYADTILNECSSMIKDNQSEQLHRMFSLINRTPDRIQPMLDCLQNHITQQGRADMTECASIITSDSEKYIELLLNLFKKYSDMVKLSFDDDPRFLTARDKAFEKVVNDSSIFALELNSRGKQNASKQPPESRCPELLANFCDMLLRKTPLSKKLSSEEIDEKLKDVLLLLKYVSNKDVFMRYHKAHLARRLILGSSADSEKEENMVEGLREVGMPADYVNKLAQMFQDIKVSEDLNQQLKESQSSSMSDIATIKVLKAGSWSRKTEKIPVSLPSMLEDFISDVEEFYKRQHNGRKLTWNHLMSHGVLTFKTEVGKYDLELTTFQMSTLSVWNSRPRDEISFDSLRLATQLPDIELRKTLWSLVANNKLKRQILLCTPKVSSLKDFVDLTQFSINHQFGLLKGGNPVKRGRVNLVGRLQLASEKSREENNDGITELRIFRTQEAIVKIMKMRKRIGNAQLQTELVEMLKNMFLPQKKLIKQQIEWLIERDFMVRDETDINTFIYVT